MAGDWIAEQNDWRAQARAAGPGYKVWRWEDVDDVRGKVTYHFRLLAPGEARPDPWGVVIEP